MIEARGRAAELTEEQLLRIHGLMLTGRILETRLLEPARAGELCGPLHPGIGQEAAMVGLAAVLEEGDVFAGSHRDLSALLARGVTVEQVLLNVFGKAAAPAGGRDCGIGFALPARHTLMIEPHGPPNHQVAVGCALAFASRGEPRVVLAHCGEGATAEGSWHEAVNLAAVHRLPIVFAVQTNGFAGPQRSSAVGALEYVAHRADGYGIPGVVVDGTDVLDCIAAAGEAIDTARAGGGPAVIEAVSFRRCGHTAAEPESPADPDEVAAWEGRDPIDRFEEYLGVRGLLDEARRSDAWEAAERRVAASLAWAREQGGIDPGDLATGVFAEVPPVPAAVRPEKVRDLSMSEALRAALDAAMARDERVVVIGRDVAAAGGSHGVSSGLLDRYGATRLFDVPGSAAAAISAGVGAALEGSRPVVEVPAAGGLDLGVIAGWAARHHWKTGHPVPIVVRVPCGPGVVPAPEAALASVPGLRVVAASTPESAFGLLTAAIRDPNPVILLEPTRRYSDRGPVPDGVHEIPLGSARVVQAGGDVTVVAWGAAVAVALEACDLLPDVSVEVVDLVSLAPLDWTTVLTSVRRTSRLVVLDEGTFVGGVAAELAGRGAAEALWDLDAPVVRLSPAGASAPFSPAHPGAHLLTPVEAAEAVRSATST